VADALAKGDLQHRVIKSYPGVFGEAARSINATVEALNEVVSEVRLVVDAAANGQFGITLDEQGKLGYVHTLAGLLNRLTKTSRLALQDILTVADQMSEGNLTVQLENQHPGLFGETGDALNKTVTQLQEIIGQVVSLVDVVLIAANRLADGNRELMQQMREQESGLSAAMRQMGDVAGKLRENALETNKASEMAQTSTVIAEQGSQVVRQTVTTMTDISESSRRIGEIIGVIDGIAFQTNILALNAAVEAARAGEQGRGFAVVATEVRSLAQRSAQAAQEIKSLITESAGKVVVGTQRVNQAGDAMGRIVESIYEMNSLMVDISQMTTRQTEGIDDVVGAVDQVNNMNRQNSQLINSAGDSVVSLVEQAESLRRLMDSFQLNR
jgi:methyl-accepting chemotaxis protein